MPARATALFEALFVLAVSFGTRAVLHRLGAGIASGTLSVVATLALATWLLRRRGSSWGALGLRRPPSMHAAALWATGLFMADMLLLPPLMSLIATGLHYPPQHLEAFADLRGNLGRYLVLLIPVTWGSAAFGEELIFRGFLLRRLTEAGGSTGAADLLAILGQAALFAFGHAYLGPRGMLNAGALGLLAGLCYRWNGRNLWPLFIAHGLVDSIGMTVLFLGMAHS